MFSHEKVFAMEKNCIVVRNYTTQNFYVLYLKFSLLQSSNRAHTYTNQTVPYGTALLGWCCSRHFVPGYDRAVPPGHLATGVRLRFNLEAIVISNVPYLGAIQPRVSTGLKSWAKPWVLPYAGS